MLLLRKGDAMNRPIEINGDMVLSLAASVSARFHSEEPFDFFCDVKDEEVIKRCTKASRWTLLHEYIADICYDDIEYLIRKHFTEEAEKEIKLWLDSLKIPYDEVSCERLDSDEGISEDKIYAYHLLEFLNCHGLKIIAEATFALLFQDKDFLYDFNLAVTKQIRELKKDNYPDYMEDDGYLKRENPPMWLKKGVFYRDKGRCQACGTDLTKIFVVADNDNYDHIIPLRQGGTNDPTNYQLMCEHCNKSKQDRSSTYRNIIWPYWE